MKLITVVGTRPEIIRLSCIIRKLDQHFTHILVHTGQNWDTNLKDVFFKEMKIRDPDHHLNVVGKNLGETMGNVISKSYDLFVELKPDCLLILGDTNSGLCSIAAKRLKIPIFHMEAGNRCFDMNVPEEINRKLIDHISDINLPYTENSRRYLLAEGVRPDHIFVTGSPLTEVLKYYKTDITNSTVLNMLKLQAKGYLVLSLHREENIDIDKNLNEIVKSLNIVSAKYPMPIIFSTHPRTRIKLEQKGIVLPNNIRSIIPLGFFDWCNLQSNSVCVLSDSGTITEESAILGFPAVSFRTSTERPEGLDSGSIIISNIKSDRLVESIDTTIKMANTDMTVPIDYTNTNVSDKIVKIIQSYTPIVNKVTWDK